MRLSVVIPAYNMAAYLPQALDSILEQGIRDSEVIVVDDHSTDNTADVVAPYKDKVKFVPNPKHNGVSAVRNYGIEIAQGDYIAFLDADDIMKPGKLKEQLDFLDRQADIALVFTNFRNFRKDGPEPRDFLANHEDFQKMEKVLLSENNFRISGPKAVEIFMDDNFIGTPSVVMMRRKVISEVGNFDEGLSGSEDLDLWIRVARKYDLGYINKELSLRRLHDNNTSSKESYFWAQLKNVEKQKKFPLTPLAQSRLKEYAARLYFTVAYQRKINGSKIEAFSLFLKSFQMRPSLKSFFAMLKAPF